MAENKIQIQAQVNIASGPAEVARLNKQLADLAKKLKLTINDVNIAGTKMASGTSQATQKATQAMSKYELELNKVLHAYKMKQTADEKFVQTAERMMKSDKFKELSAKKQLELLNQRITAEKNLDRIYDIGIAKDKQVTNQKLNNMNKLHSEALRMNKEFNNLAKTQRDLADKKFKSEFDALQKIETQNKNNEKLRSRSQDFIKSSQIKLQGYSNKYDLADQTKATKLMQEFNMGGKFKDFNSMPEKIKQYRSEMAKVLVEMRQSHKLNLNDLNSELRIEKEKEQEQRRQIANMNRMHGEALRMNTQINKQIEDAAKTQQKTQQKIYSLASGGSSSFKPYDDYQKASTQTSAQGRLQTVQNSFASMQKNRMFGSVVSADELNTINAQMNKLQANISKISNNKMAQKWNTELAGVKNTLGGINTQLPKSIGYFANLKNIIGKFSDWLIVSTLIFLPLQAFQKGLQTLKEIDTQLVDIAKVTDLTKEQMRELAKEATKVGIEFGRTTQEYLSSITEFSRAGYGESAKDLGKVSMLLQNVGDVNDEVANSFLLATDAAYKLGGSERELTNVVNGLNNVSNKNATTISKVAEGMSVSASIAEQAGIKIEELSGAISTMTIVTQRSGSEAGRAFKGILMNLRQVKG
jgi:hypothetical protein